jgi:glyceraldehyde 3-phosphate dehydrogenase
VATVVHGVNQAPDDMQVISCASCTTNCITPVVEVLDRRIGVERAIMSTVHAYTSTQQLVDGPSRDVRRGRAAGANMVPASTGAALATTRALPALAGRFDGVAIRVPVPVGSVADIVAVTARPTTAEEVNDVFRQEAGTDRYRDVLAVCEEPLVSTDIIGDPRASVIDAAMTLAATVGVSRAGHRLLFSHSARTAAWLWSTSLVAVSSMSLSWAARSRRCSAASRCPASRSSAR